MFDQSEPRPPPAELIRGLAVLAEPPTDEHPRIVEALGIGPTPTPAEYSDLFLFQLYPYASVHLGPEGMMGGEARARVAGFWRALGYEPPAEPDHLAALLGLYAALLEAGESVESRTGASGVEAAAQRRLIVESQSALLREHVAPWVFTFLRRVGELTGGVYAQWAGLLEDTLRAELSRVAGVSNPAAGDRSAPLLPVPLLPVHLRQAPPLPDPREAGAGEFVAGLLAPVRAGFVLTRADVAKVASACEVGLRAGERRYALEHLLAQDGPGVLRALAGEARRQAVFHEECAVWLGEVATFFAERAHQTAALLDVLAAEESAREESARDESARDESARDESAREEVSP